ncbi:MAG: hypothetical protein MUO53_10115 [Maribacter sp.]|nr:hypothetical protein [Maribacter sp.]
MTQTDKIRYLAYEHIFYDSWETLYEGYQDGLVDEKTWMGWNEYILKEARRKPIFGRKGNLDQFGMEFLEYIQTDLGLKID